MIPWGASPELALLEWWGGGAACAWPTGPPGEAGARPKGGPPPPGVQKGVGGETPVFVNKGDREIGFQRDLQVRPTNGWAKKRFFFFPIDRTEPGGKVCPPWAGAILRRQRGHGSPQTPLYKRAWGRAGVGVGPGKVPKARGPVTGGNPFSQPETVGKGRPGPHARPRPIPGGKIHRFFLGRPPPPGPPRSNTPLARKSLKRDHQTNPSRSPHNAFFALARKPGKF